MSKSILVAGGAGFIGSHLCERLLAQGHHVTVLDDLSTGSLEHLAPLLVNPRLQFLRHDITQELPPAIGRIDRVFNLACPASPAYYQRHPIHTTLTSALGTWHLLELAQRDGALFVQASTSEVYGDPQVHPQREDYHGHVSPIGPRSCYDEGKRCAEALCFACHRERGQDIRVARIFNSYGPRLHPGDGRVVSNFIVQSLRGEPLTVYGDGQQTRSFCYVADTVDGLLRLAEAPVTGPVNIGNPVEHTVLELARMVQELTGSAAGVRFHPLPPDDPRRRRPDIQLARQALSWHPRTGLADGLAQTIAYFRTVLLPQDQQAPRFAA